jgi:hypothetical protein
MLNVPRKEEMTPIRPSLVVRIPSTQYALYLKQPANVEVLPMDILSAFHLRSKRTGPRPILVIFNSLQLRTAVIRSRRPKQQLEYNGTNIYVNDHLTKASSNLVHTARKLVKHDAHATWVRDGQIFIKWSATSRFDVVHSMSDLI